MYSDKCVSVYVVQLVLLVRFSVPVLDCVFPHVSCVTATHNAVITVTKSTALITTVSFVCESVMLS